MSQTHEFAFPPDFNALPAERIEAHVDKLAAQMDGHFPEFALQTERGIQADPALGARQEQSFPIGLRVGGAQVDGPMSPGFGEHHFGF